MARARRVLANVVGTVAVLAAIIAVLAGMIHATGELHDAAMRRTPVVVPTLANSGPTLPPQDVLSVQGTKIVDGTGKPVTLLGATDYSLEFLCSGDGHLQLSDFRAMRTWGINTVRITLSSAFWRNLDGTCPNYAATVTGAVSNALSAGLFVILTLQWDAPFSLPQDAKRGGAQCPLPDATFDVSFWQDLAEIYQTDPRVIFDLFGEPHDIDWSHWETGGTITSSCARYAVPYTYKAIGMPELARKVRAIAPLNLIIISGIGWGYDLSGIQTISPLQMNNILYGTHPFNHALGADQPDDWPRAFGSIATRLPVIATEFGDYNCQTGYIAQEISYFEHLHMSFVAWAWTTGSCATPSLLANWSGAPSVPYGVYIQRQMLAAAKGS